MVFITARRRIMSCQFASGLDWFHWEIFFPKKMLGKLKMIKK